MREEGHFARFLAGLKNGKSLFRCGLKMTDVQLLASGNKQLTDLYPVPRSYIYYIIYRCII